MPNESQGQSGSKGRDESRAQSWISLLAHWTEFAQAAKALPSAGEGGRWKSATPAIIGLQAVTFALADLRNLKPDERRLGIDRAQILVPANMAKIHETWKGEALPSGLVELIDDATAALGLALGVRIEAGLGAKVVADSDATNAQASAEKPTMVNATAEAGLEWSVTAERLIAEHPAALVESLLAAGFDGDLYVPTPGVPLFEGCPMVFAKSSAGAPVSVEARSLIEEFFDAISKPVRALVMNQAFRQFDFGKGRAVRDVVVPVNVEPPGGQPLLMPAILDGKPFSVPLPIRGAAAQKELPVVFLDDRAKSGSKGRGR